MTTENNSWYRGTADAIYQNIDFLRESHEPYVIITSGDCVYKIDFNKMLEYHINKKQILQWARNWAVRMIRHVWY